jgi:hypothetical protein
MTIPDHIRYGSPEECKDALSRPMRCESRQWIHLPEPDPLPTGELRAIHDPLLTKRITRYNERQVSR